jgi:murein DD-endopeptidase MepM/ murein hydrolase activator NlpD
VKKLEKRWIGSLAVCIFLLALGVHPSAARLSEGNFVPFSQAANSFADSQAKSYRIQKGDTLFSIAQRYNVSLKNLMLYNQMNEKTILQIGYSLRIPTAPGMIQVVATGDMMSDVEERYRVAQSISEPSRSLSTPKLMKWPVAGPITSSFGWRKGGYHHGIDIANKIGTPIEAAAAGTVSFTGYKSVYGLTVIIDHPDGKQTLYAHTQKTYVHKGDKVSQGETIATVGMTGVTTGPHLHFEVRNENQAINPLSYLRR